MKKKKGLFVKAVDYDRVVSLLRGADIRYTSEYGIFHFDLTSLLIGLVLGIAFGILVF